jgi:hypothetical protein
MRASRINSVHFLFMRDLPTTGRDLERIVMRLLYLSALGIAGALVGVIALGTAKGLPGEQAQSDARCIATGIKEALRANPDLRRLPDENAAAVLKRAQAESRQACEKSRGWSAQRTESASQFAQKDLDVDLQTVRMKQMGIDIAPLLKWFKLQNKTLRTTSFTTEMKDEKSRSVFVDAYSEMWEAGAITQKATDESHDSVKHMISLLVARERMLLALPPVKPSL